MAENRRLSCDSYRVEEFKHYVEEHQAVAEVSSSAQPLMQHHPWKIAAAMERISSQSEDRIAV